MFAMNIFKMYEKYAHNKGWKFDVVDIAQSDMKGFKEATAAILGVGVFGKLKFESGIHRVQVIVTASHIKSTNTSLSTISDILFFISEFL